MPRREILKQSRNTFRNSCVRNSADSAPHDREQNTHMGKQFTTHQHQPSQLKGIEADPDSQLEMLIKTNHNKLIKGAQ